MVISLSQPGLLADQDASTAEPTGSCPLEPPDPAKHWLAMLSVNALIVDYFKLI
jgi:hypothetical protein